MDNNTKKIVITGGHPAPALAVIDEIRETRRKWEINFIGVKHPLTDDGAIAYEYKEISKRNLPFFNLITGKGTGISIVRLPIGAYSSFYWLVKIQPDVVLTFGGYIGVPVALAAFILRIPVVTHEQSLRIGLANKLINWFSVKVFLSWPQTKNSVAPKNSYLASRSMGNHVGYPTVASSPARGESTGQASEKFVVTGLPLRKSITRVIRPDFVSQFERIDKPLLYVTGGSQGAHYINQLVQKKLKGLLEKFKIIHQVGESTKYQDLTKMERIRRPDYLPLAHIASEEIGWVLQEAEIIVARAGINTVAELLYLNKSAVLIPLPKNVNPEQRDNAELYGQSRLGRVFEQGQATANKFLKTVLDLSDAIRDNRIKRREVKGQRLQSPEAAERVLTEIEKILNKSYKHQAPSSKQIQSTNVQNLKKF